MRSSKQNKKICYPHQKWGRFGSSRKCLGAKITGVSHPEKNYRFILGSWIYCAIRI